MRCQCSAIELLRECHAGFVRRHIGHQQHPEIAGIKFSTGTYSEALRLRSDCARIEHPRIISKRIRHRIEVIFCGDVAVKQFGCWPLETSQRARSSVLKCPERVHLKTS